MYIKIEVIGRLTRDPKFSYTNNGTPVCNFTIAADSGYGKQKETVFLKCTVWRGTAKFVAKYIHKGHLVFARGDMKVEMNKTKKGTYKNPKLMARTIKILSDPKATKEEYEPEVKELTEFDSEEDSQKEVKKETEFDDNFDADNFDVPF